jgi:hypothetical protein
MVINGYYINDYWWLFMAIILMVIANYSINGYWWLFHYKPFVVIPL